MKSMKLACLIIFGITTPMISGGWIDIDTPEEFRQTRSFVDGTVYDLVRELQLKNAIS